MVRMFTFDKSKYTISVNSYNSIKNLSSFDSIYDYKNFMCVVAEVATHMLFISDSDKPSDAYTESVLHKTNMHGRWYGTISWNPYNALYAVSVRKEGKNVWWNDCITNMNRWYIQDVLNKCNIVYEELKEYKRIYEAR